MTLSEIVSHVEAWTVEEIHALKAWLDAHVLHRAANSAEASPQPAPDAQEPAAEPGEHTDGA